MNIASLIDQERILLGVEADCPKQIFRIVSTDVEARTGIPARDVTNALAERERLGTTAVGNKVSIPHARLEKMEAPLAYFVRPTEPIDMDAPDDLPVEMYFIMFVPDEADNDHLRILSKIARILRNDAYQHVIRESTDKQEILLTLTSEDSVAA